MKPCVPPQRFSCFGQSDALWDQLDEGIRLIGKTDTGGLRQLRSGLRGRCASVPVETAQTAYRYLTYGGAENLGNLFRFLDALPNAAAVPEPVPVPWEGLWHPDAPVRAFATVRGYLEWYAGYACERGLSLDPERTGRIAVRSALLGQRHARRGSGTCPCSRSEGLGRVSGLYEYAAGQGDRATRGRRSGHVRSFLGRAGAGSGPSSSFCRTSPITVGICPRLSETIPRRGKACAFSVNLACLSSSLFSLPQKHLRNGKPIRRV